MSWMVVVLGGDGCNLGVRESALLDVFISPHRNRDRPQTRDRHNLVRHSKYGRILTSMSYQVKYAPTLNGVPHLSRVRATLYLMLYYICGVLHPRYRAYIEAVAAHERLHEICSRAQELDAVWGNPETTLSGLTLCQNYWRETDLPDIYFTLLFAWRLIRPRPWSGLQNPDLEYQIFPALEPG